jgi:hypothetical protein
MDWPCRAYHLYAARGHLPGANNQRTGIEVCSPRCSSGHVLPEYHLSIAWPRPASRCGDLPSFPPRGRRFPEPSHFITGLHKSLCNLKYCHPYCAKLYPYCAAVVLLKDLPTETSSLSSPSGLTPLHLLFSRLRGVPDDRSGTSAIAPDQTFCRQHSPLAEMDGPQESQNTSPRLSVGSGPRFTELL